MDMVGIRWFIFGWRFRTKYGNVFVIGDGSLYNLLLGLAGGVKFYRNIAVAIEVEPQTLPTLYGIL